MPVAPVEPAIRKKQDRGFFFAPLGPVVPTSIDLNLTTISASLCHAGCISIRSPNGCHLPMVHYLAPQIVANAGLNARRLVAPIMLYAYRAEIAFFQSGRICDSPLRQRFRQGMSATRPTLIKPH